MVFGLQLPIDIVLSAMVKALGMPQWKILHQVNLTAGRLHDMMTFFFLKEGILMLMCITVKAHIRD